MNNKLFWYTATVVRIIDADTIVLDIDLGLHTSRKETVRLNRINAWEIRGHDKELGHRAKQYVEENAPVGSNVFVHTFRDKSGKYGRLLVDIYIDEFVCLNDALVDNGHAKYEKY